MWCHTSISSKLRRSLRFVALMLLLVALSTTFFLTTAVNAVTGTNKTINFQGRLQTPSGAIVADGYYNMQFKLYQDGTGTTAGNPGGSLKWTESYVNNGGTSGVSVKNGYFAVSLGSVNPFGTSVDWNQDTIFLSMNVAGNSSACTTFGNGVCNDDGEMLPMKRITATPFAINSGAVGGKTADNFVQLAQGVQIDASTNTSSIHINKTGAGNLIQLQNTATDVFTVTNTGDLTLGSNADKTISIATSADNTDGKELAIVGGAGGNGDGANGGNLSLQGGAAGGTNGNGGSIQIDAGAKTGIGTDGTIAIGTMNASSITIGSTDLATNQNISIGANNTVGSSSNVTIGSGGLADSGTTTIQGKDAVTIATNGTTRATFSDTTNTVYFGNGVSAAAPSDATIQGTNSSAAAVAGGTLTVQGGNATIGDANGGNVVLAGGSGSGSGANGLVVLTTPTFSTVSNDANCFTGGSRVGANCTISQASVDSSSAIMTGFTTTGRTATLPDPTIKTAGRIMYITTASNSMSFTLSINGGATASNLIPMRENTAITMLWNGDDWLTVGGTSSGTLQDSYNSTPQSTPNAKIMLENGTGGVSIENSPSAPVDGNLLQVKNANGTSVLSATNTSPNLVTDSGVKNSTNFSTNWQGFNGASSISRHVGDGQDDLNSVQATFTASTPDAGVTAQMTESLVAYEDYRISVYVKQTSGTLIGNNFRISYSTDGGYYEECTPVEGTISILNQWTRLSCIIAVSGYSGSTSTPTINFIRTAAASQTIRIDNFSIHKESPDTSGVKIGSNQSDDVTLFTVDKASGPQSGEHDALLGSMYYDTTIGKLQCYEAEGWGNCGASPDNFVTLIPEFANAVTNGNGTGIMTSDLCSDSLNINDGSSAQPTVCGTNETYNFYNWKSSDVADQTKSIFVTYKLPASFKNFAPGTTSLMGRTDSIDSSVTYQIYRNNNETGLTPCGSLLSVSTGSQSTWQSAVASGSADPSTCGFTENDSIVIKINLTAANGANAYVSNLGFTFSNN